MAHSVKKKNSIVYSKVSLTLIHKYGIDDINLLG